MDGLEISNLGLEFIVKNRHFKDRKMVIKCTAMIAGIYWQTQKIATLEKPEKLVQNLQKERESEIFASNIPNTNGKYIAPLL